MYTLLLYFARVVFCSNLFLRAIFHLTSCCSLRTWLLRIYNGIWLRESDCFRTAIAIKSFPYTVCFSSSFFLFWSTHYNYHYVSDCAEATPSLSLSLCMCLYFVLNAYQNHSFAMVKHGMKENVWNTHAKCFHVSSDFVVIVSFNTIDCID